MDEIDALLDEEFGLTGEDLETETQVEEPVTEDTPNEQEPETESTEEDKVDDINNNDTNQNAEEENSTITKEDKRNNAFADLRNQVKQERERADNENAFIKELAASYGYTDTEKFKADVRRAKMERDAEAKGIDKDVYMQMQSQAEEIKQLKQANADRENAIKTEKFVKSIDNAEKTYNISRDEIFSRLEEAGYDADNILDVPNLDVVIRGVLVDEIQKMSKQEQLNDIKKLDDFTDEKHTDTNSNTKLSIDDIIKEEMKQYKADNYL